MRVAEAIGRTLGELGVRDFFGLVGSGNFHVTNALKDSGARFISARHETAAVTMADAYARASGQLGVCTLHQGPGATNALTGLVEAAKSRTPLLVLAGDVTSTLSNFWIDEAKLASVAGASHQRLHSAETAVADVARAAHMAVANRRTVLVSLPLEIQAAECRPDGEWARPATVKPQSAAFSDVEAVAELLNSAKRPLLLGGRGAVLSGAREPMEQLAEQTGALLATSAVTKGLFAGNPWYIGISGGFATPLAADLIAKSDLIVAFGASLNMWTTRRGHLISPTAKLAQVDDDPHAIGVHRLVDVALVGDCAATARAITEGLGAKHSTGWRSDQLAAQIGQHTWRRQPFVDSTRDGLIDPRTLTIELDQILPKNRTVAVDSGHFMGWPAMYLDVPDGRAFVFTQSFMSIGLGLATGVGAAVARPEHLTVIALGDGGALMSISELDTLARLSPEALVVVYNDSSYAAEVHHFRPDGASTDIVEFPETDFAAVARAFGLDAAIVRSPSDLNAVRDWQDRGRPGPLLLDAKIVPSVVAEWIEEAFRGH